MADYEICGVCKKRYREDGAHEDICLAREKAAKIKLSKTCDHEWETFRDYCGTSYNCKICNKWEGN